jgi:hypothetical protein
MENLELRMYGLVNYQLTGIQQGIQFGHAVVEYGQMVKKISTKNPESKVAQQLMKEYDEWADFHKTFIILNGGTTNNQFLKLGSLNKHTETLKSNGVNVAEFRETDLGDQLTATVFIVDERVFNKEKYPDFSDWVINSMENEDIFNKIGKVSDIDFEKFAESDDIDKLNLAKNWRDFVGGDKNVFLRTFLKNFRLA